MNETSLIIYQMFAQKQGPRLSGDFAIFSSLVAITDAGTGAVPAAATGAGACGGFYYLVDRDSPHGL